MDRCPFCGGDLEERAIRYPQEYEGRIVILANVPAQVCRQCGEVFLEPDVIERVQRLVWESPPPRQTLEVPVYDLAEAS